MSEVSLIDGHIDKGMTDEVIIKVLECCFLSECACENCPYSNLEICDTAKMIKMVIDFINRQKAEIENVNVYCENLEISQNHLLNELATAKSEAIKEFAERLKSKVFTPLGTWFTEKVVTENSINNLVKEMTGD